VREKTSDTWFQGDLARTTFEIGSLQIVSGRMAEALESYQKALAVRELLVREKPLDVQLQSDVAWSRFAIGNLRAGAGRTSEALDFYGNALAIQETLVRKNPSAIWFRRDLAISNNAIGDLKRVGAKPVDALESLQKALSIQERLAHENRSIVVFQSDLSKSHNDIGVHHQTMGRTSEALESLRKALTIRETLVLENSTIGEYQSYVTVTRNNIRESERLETLEAKLPAILNGAAQPQDEEEVLALADLCDRKSMHNAAARLYEAALAGRTNLGDPFPPARRQAAADAAALAGCGSGTDGPPPGEADRARWREKARAWLRADLAAWEKILETGSPQARAQLQSALANWKADDDLAGIRDETNLAKFSEEERIACRALWVDVDALLKKAGTSALGLATQKGKD
jgi:tetratricopeptide (TPR) repeat protein